MLADERFYTASELARLSAISEEAIRAAMRAHDPSLRLPNIPSGKKRPVRRASGADFREWCKRRARAIEE